MSTTPADVAVLRERLEARAGAVGASQVVTIDDLANRYLDWSRQRHKQRREGSSQTTNMRDALRPVCDLYGSEPVGSLTPTRLRAVRLLMIERGLARGTINSRINRIRTVWRWAVSRELVTDAVVRALAAVEGLVSGEDGARESGPVEPVCWAIVERTGQVMPAWAWAVTRVCWWTGARSGEVMALRGCDIDRTEIPWRCELADHKTAGRGRRRTLFFGPRSIAAMQPWITPARLWPYRQQSYRNAVCRACAKAHVPHWTPHQLRHAAATRIRKVMDIEASRAVLGHATQQMTAVYAERDIDAARDVMRALG